MDTLVINKPWIFQKLRHTDSAGEGGPVLALGRDQQNPSTVGCLVRVEQCVGWIFPVVLGEESTAIQTALDPRCCRPDTVGDQRSRHMATFAGRGACIECRDDCGVQCRGRSVIADPGNGKRRGLPASWV